MKTWMTFIAGVVLAVVCIEGLAAYSKTRTSLSQIVSPKDPALDYLAARWMDKVGAWLPNERWARNEVRKNTAEALKIWRIVANDPRKVRISKTQDTQVYVITVQTAGGRCATLWLDSDGSVESIDPD